jgi:hypothetical protein
MFDSIALFPLALRPEAAAEKPPRKGLAAMFAAAMESLVQANSRGFEDIESAWYRYPPI